MASINPIIKLVVRNVYGGDVGGSHAEAVRSYLRAAQLCPRRLTHYAELGKAYLKLGRKQDALEALDAALRRAPLSGRRSHGPVPVPLCSAMHNAAPCRGAQAAEPDLRPNPRRCEVEDINAQNGRAHAALIRSELMKGMRAGGRGAARDLSREAKEHVREARRRVRSRGGSHRPPIRRRARAACCLPACPQTHRFGCCTSDAQRSLLRACVCVCVLSSAERQRRSSRRPSGRVAWRARRRGSRAKRRRSGGRRRRGRRSGAQATRSLCSSLCSCTPPISGAFDQLLGGCSEARVCVASSRRKPTLSQTRKAVKARVKGRRCRAARGPTPGAAAADCAAAAADGPSGARRGASQVRPGWRAEQREPPCGCCVCALNRGTHKGPDGLRHGLSSRHEHHRVEANCGREPWKADASQGISGSRTVLTPLSIFYLYYLNLGTMLRHLTSVGMAMRRRFVVLSYHDDGRLGLLSRLVYFRLCKQHSGAVRRSEGFPPVVLLSCRRRQAGADGQHPWRAHRLGEATTAGGLLPAKDAAPEASQVVASSLWWRRKDRR